MSNRWTLDATCDLCGKVARFPVTRKGPKAEWEPRLPSGWGHSWSNAGGAYRVNRYVQRAACDSCAAEAIRTNGPVAKELLEDALELVSSEAPSEVPRLRALLGLLSSEAARLGWDPDGLAGVPRSPTTNRTTRND